jgi:TonB-linked SusC/RagA family outer membrane protein
MDYWDMRRDLLYQNSKGGKPYYYYWNPNDLPSEISLQEWKNYTSNPAEDPLEEWFMRIDHYPIEQQNFLAGKTTNFYDEVIGKGIRQDYNLSVGGALENIQYYMSVGYLNNEGIIKGDAFSTVRTRLNLDFKVTDWFNIGTNTQFAYRDESVVEASLSMLSKMSPYGNMYNDDGSLVMYPHEHQGSRNPLEDYVGQDRLRDINSLFSVLYADLKLPFGITYRLSYQPRFAFTKDFNFWSSDTYTGRNTYKNGYGTRSLTNSYSWMLDNLLKWNKTFGVHNFDVTLLANAERNKSWLTYQYNSEFAPNQNLGYNALQFGAKPGLSNTDNISSGDALMARLNYTLLNKYLLTASIRRDGYSAFGQKNPRAVFPAFAFAWKINEEPFYNIPWMDRLKLRLSWGENGNREIGAYSALAQMGAVLNLNAGGNVETGVYNTRLANPNLVWERTESYNLGIDVGLLGNRIDLVLDAYMSKTHDLLLNRQLPRITGFTSITSNLGVLANRGIEATLNTMNITRTNFSWRSSLIFSLNRNEIEELWGDYGDYKILNTEQYGELPDFQNKWFPGYARDIIWDYERIGIWQLDEAEDAVSYGLVPGDYKAADVDGDGDYSQFEDKKFIGYTVPRYCWGLTNEFDVYKNFSISVFVRADLGHIREIPNTGNRSEHNRYNDWSWDYWSPENPGAKFQRNTYPDNLSQFEGSIRPFEPAGFLRVQDLSLVYNVRMDKVKRLLPFQSLRIMLTGRNLMTFTKWPGFDPEASGTTPMPKTFTFGIDMSL